MQPPCCFSKSEIAVQLWDGAANDYLYSGLICWCLGDITVVGYDDSNFPSIGG